MQRLDCGIALPDRADEAFPFLFEMIEEPIRFHAEELNSFYHWRSHLVPLSCVHRVLALKVFLKKF
jgi:hypothetical protein